jgi:hypothetical protein
LCPRTERHARRKLMILGIWSSPKVRPLGLGRGAVHKRRLYTQRTSVPSFGVITVGQLPIRTIAMQ